MKTIRTIIERICRGKILKRVITVAGEKAPIYITPDAQLKYLKRGNGAFDHDLIQIAENFLEKDSNVWDIGANVGVFTFSSAVIASEGTIVAVEADTWLASILRRSARLDKYHDVDIRVVPAAISEADGIEKFMIAARGRASNALESAGGRSQMGGVREAHHVPTLRLDTLLYSMPRPNFIKIDVEGAELMVLKGASRIITEIRPIFYIEVGNNVSTEIMKLFSDQDFVALSPDGTILKERCAFNTLSIPKENTKAQQVRIR